MGVKAVAVDIQVGVSPASNKTDAEIAEAVVNALKWHTAVQEDKIKIKVEDGVVKLEGEVEWEFQRSNAEQAIANLTGVRLVSNFITIRPKVKSDDVKENIKAAFHRSATIDSGRISVDIIGNTVSLYGVVRSFAEKDDAEKAAWAAPGVTAVENKLVLEVPEYSYEE
jgi:osmotically-inducible protein OsmY